MQIRMHYIYMIIQRVQGYKNKMSSPSAMAIHATYLIYHIMHVYATVHTDKKGNQIFLIYKEIQTGSGVKSYMTNGFLIYMTRYLCNSSYIRKPFLMYDFAPASLYVSKIFFSFLSVQYYQQCQINDLSRSEASVLLLSFQKRSNVNVFKSKFWIETKRFLSVLKIF